MEAFLRYKIAIAKILLLHRLCLLGLSERLRLRNFYVGVDRTADTRVSHLKVFFDVVFNLALDRFTVAVVLRRDQMLFQIATESL